jgi:uncharacterized protein (DUF697 family)
MSTTAGMLTTLLATGGCDISKQLAVSLATGLLTAYLQENAFKFAARKFVSWVPGWGNGLEAVAAVAAVESLGWAMYTLLGCYGDEYGLY